MTERARRGISRNMPPVSGARNAPHVAGAPEPPQSAGPVESVLLTAEQRRAIEQKDLQRLRRIHTRGEDLAGALAFAFRNGGAAVEILALLLEELQIRITSEALEWAVTIRNPRKFMWVRQLVCYAPATTENLITLARGPGRSLELLLLMVARWRGKLPLEVATSFARKADVTARNDRTLRQLLQRVPDLAEPVDLIQVLAPWSALSVRAGLERGAALTVTAVRALLEAGNGAGLMIFAEWTGGASRLPGGVPDLNFALLRAPSKAVPEIASACLKCGALVARSTLAALGQRWVSELGATDLFPGGEVLQVLNSALLPTQHVRAFETVIGVIQGQKNLSKKEAQASVPVLRWLQRRLSASKANLKEQVASLYSPSSPSSSPTP